VLFVGFAGTGPLPPLARSDFDSDPWTFSADMLTFASAPIEIVNLAGGLVVESLLWRGSLSSLVPILSGIGVLGLGAGLALPGGRVRFASVGASRGTRNRSGQVPGAQARRGSGARQGAGGR